MLFLVSKLWLCQYGQEAEGTYFAGAPYHVMCRAIRAVDPQRAGERVTSGSSGVEQRVGKSCQRNWRANRSCVVSWKCSTQLEEGKRFPKIDKVCLTPKFPEYRKRARSADQGYRRLQRHPRTFASPTKAASLRVHKTTWRKGLETGDFNVVVVCTESLKSPLFRSRSGQCRNARPVNAGTLCVQLLRIITNFHRLNRLRSYHHLAQRECRR